MSDMATLYGFGAPYGDLGDALGDYEASAAVPLENQTGETKMNWQNLIVTDDNGAEIGSLCEVIRSTTTAASIQIDEAGAVVAWPYHFIAAPGEVPDWNTPAGPVDWTGFADELLRELDA